MVEDQYPNVVWTDDNEVYHRIKEIRNFLTTNCGKTVSFLRGKHTVPTSFARKSMRECEQCSGDYQIMVDPE